MKTANLGTAAVIALVWFAAAGAASTSDCPPPFKRVDIYDDCSVSEDWVVIFKNSHENRPGRAAQVCWQASDLDEGHTLTLQPKYANDDQFTWSGNKKEIDGDSPNKWVLSGPPDKTGEFDYKIRVVRDSDGYEHCTLDPGVIIRD